MSRHEGVSCDACLRSNFRGRRYKCLVCYDYDLCAGCHEAGSVTSRHAADHPMQCILTRTDAELFYGGEAVPPERAQSLVCPHCGQLGLTELSLADHVAARHGDVTTQVVCPVCAAVPSGEPNHVTENLSAHLSTDHRGGGSGRLLSSSDSEPSAAGRSAGRRAPQRGVGAARTRRFNMHFRESMDPITELLSQLSGAGRTAASSSASSTASQLQQLQMHLQLERQQYAQVVRQHSERAPRRQAASAASTPAAPAPAPAPDTARDERPTSSTAATTVQSASPPPADSQFLLARVRDEERSLDEARQAADRADRCLFAQEIVLSTLTESLQECLTGCESESAPAVAAGGAVGGATGGADSGAVERTEPPAAAAAPAPDPASPPPPPSEPRPTAAAAAPAIGRGGGARGVGNGGAAVRVPGRVSAAAAQPGVGARLLAARGPRKAARPAAAVEGRPSPR